MQRILVAVDGSTASNRAYDLALGLSCAYGSELLVCMVVDQAATLSAATTPDGVYPSVQLVLDEVEVAAKSLLDSAAAKATAAGSRATTTLLEGRPANAIVAFAEERSVDAIVMGSQGKTGLERAFVGSTAEGVLHLTSIPTFVVHHSNELPATQRPSDPMRFQRILVALDDSDPSDAALTVAIDLAVESDATLLCTHVIETSDLFDKAATYGYDPSGMLADVRRSAEALIETKERVAQGRSVRVERVVAEGAAADALLEAAAAHRADLIVVGTHGRRGLRRLIMGSVAESLLRRSNVPVVVVRAPKHEAAILSRSAAVHAS